MVRVMSANVTQDEAGGEPGSFHETVHYSSEVLSSTRGAGAGEAGGLSIRTKEHRGSAVMKRGSGAYSIVTGYSPRICSCPADRARVSSNYSKR